MQGMPDFTYRSAFRVNKLSIPISPLLQKTPNLVNRSQIIIMFLILIMLGTKHNNFVRTRIVLINNTVNLLGKTVTELGTEKIWDYSVAVLYERLDC